MKISNIHVRDWLFRGLMFEADADRFRSAGIRIGSNLESAERSLLEDALAPFSVEDRNESLQMARLYAQLYCFENSVRSLISERLLERHGANWWKDKVPVGVQKFAESRQKSDLANAWLEGRRQDLLLFIEFGHLADIIIHNWADFQDLIPSQHWLKQRMDELEKTRNFIAHNRLLLSAEFKRIELYIADWNRQVGF